MLKSVDTLSGRLITGFLIFGVAGTALGTAISAFFQGLPWGVPVAIFLLLFVYGLAGASYERIEAEKIRHRTLEEESNKKLRTTEADKKKLEEQLTTAVKRKAVKDLLGEAVEKGKDLQITARVEDDDTVRLVDKRDVEEWVHRSRDLIEAAFDKGEARHFLNSEGYNPEKPLPFRDARRDPYKYFIDPRLQRLDELIVRANELEVNPDFNPQGWKGSFA